MKKLYLFFYNVLSALGWGMVFVITVRTWFEEKSPEVLWERVWLILNITQSAAVMEVIHSKLKIVRSPFFSTFLQVLSRVIVLWLYVDIFPEARNHWSAFLLFASWGLAEVPRYLFYAIKLVGKVPKPLVWIRYSFFIVLYPTGITGELLQQFRAQSIMGRNSLAIFYSLFLFTLLFYGYGGPFMYMHMLRQRKKILGGKSAQKKPAPRKPREPEGIEFPITDETTKKRSTLDINKGAWAESIKNQSKKEYESVMKEKNWRFGYKKHVLENVRLSAKSVDSCLSIAKDGLDYVHSKFVFIRDGIEHNLDEAMKKPKKKFFTGFIEGNGEVKKDFSIPYNGKELKGKDAIKLIKRWGSEGVIEKDAMQNLIWFFETKDFKFLKDNFFVLLGATSAMGPIDLLCQLGANIVCIDINRPNVWEKLLTKIRNSAAKAWFPLEIPQSDIKSDEELFAKSGCNLLTETPEIAQFLVNLLPNEQFVMGGYAYLDGQLFVKISVAIECIIEACSSRKKRPMLGFLCSPTDAFLIPNECGDAQKQNYKNSPLWLKFWRNFPLRKIAPKPNFNKRNVFKNEKGETVTVLEGIVNMQGPNYSLAKRIQHWRCMIENNAGAAVSSNIAPSTRTQSVLHNKRFEMAYAGLHLFKPMEIFNQDTSNMVNAILLLSEVMKSNREPEKNKLEHPLFIFRNNAAHGGIWRMGYNFDTVGYTSALYFILRENKKLISSALSMLVGVTGYCIYNPPHNWFL